MDPTRLAVRRPRGLPVAARRMGVELDGEEVALLRAGEVAGLDVVPGEHALVVRAGASRSHRHRVEVRAGVDVELQVDLAWRGDDAGAGTGTYLVLVPAPPWAPLVEDESGVPLDASDLPALALGAAWFMPVVGVPLSIAALRRPGLTTGARRAAGAALLLGVAQVAAVAALVAQFLSR